MPRCNNAAQSIATLAPTISNLMKKPLPPCLRCGTPVKEARRKYCSPKCAGNGHGPSPEQLAAKARKRAQTKRVFLKALGEHGTAAAACRIARIDRRTVHVWKKEDEKFAEAWAEATEVACDVVEQSLVDRAVHGVAEPIFYKGRQVGERREYDTQAGMFFLKGRRAHVFGDHVVATHQGPEGVPLVPSLTAVQIVVRDPATIAAIEQGKMLPAPLSDPPKEYATLREKLGAHGRERRLALSEVARVSASESDAHPGRRRSNAAPRGVVISTGAPRA